MASQTGNMAYPIASVSQDAMIQAAEASLTQQHLAQQADLAAKQDAAHSHLMNQLSAEEQQLSHAQSIQHDTQAASPASVVASGAALMPVPASPDGFLPARSS